MEAASHGNTLGYVGTAVSVLQSGTENTSHATELFWHCYSLETAVLENKAHVLQRALVWHYCHLMCDDTQKDIICGIKFLESCACKERPVVLAKLSSCNFVWHCWPYQETPNQFLRFPENHWHEEKSSFWTKVYLIVTRGKSHKGWSPNPHFVGWSHMLLQSI